MKEKYVSFWRHSLGHSQKLEFNKVFKEEYSTCKSSLYQLRHFNERRNFVKFKICNGGYDWTIVGLYIRSIMCPQKIDYKQLLDGVLWYPE